MISLILLIGAMLSWSIACSIEAIMDRMVEVFYLPLPTQGERLNKNWFSYNPMNPEKGLGIMRDGWHFLKLIHYGFIALSTYMVNASTIYVKWYLFLFIVILIRFIFFNVTLKYVRKKMTSDNNFKY